MAFRNLAHVGITVADMERSLRFYTELLNAEIILDTTVSSPGLSRTVSVPDAELHIVLMQLGNTVLELIDYAHQTGQRILADNSQPGAMHVAFEVNDIDAAYQELTERGVEFNAPPYTFTDDDGPGVAGIRIAYFRDPDGNQLEMVSVPAG
ncbi:MAG: VOC family protein [Planctomycetota bacterium]